MDDPRPGPTDHRDEPPGVDVERLRTWMDERGLGAGELTGVTELTGGTQNVLV